jgi:hypothetical protein
VILLEILEANFEMQFARARDYVLAAFFVEDLYLRIALSETFQAFDELRQIGWIFAVYCDAHDRRHRELHYTQVMRVLERRDGATLDEILIDADKTANIATRYVLDRLNVGSGPSSVRFVVSIFRKGPPSCRVYSSVP